MIKLPLVIQGIILLFLSLLLILTLGSYRCGNCTNNLLGLIGYIISWCAYYCFGLACWFIPIFLTWIGLMIIYKKNLQRLS